MDMFLLVRMNTMALIHRCNKNEHYPKLVFFLLNDRLTLLCRKRHNFCYFVESNLGTRTFRDTGENFLDGSIPSSIGTLVKWYELDFSDHNLVGTIPANIGKLTDLQILKLQKNRLSGSLPSEVGRNICEFDKFFFACWRSLFADGQHDEFDVLWNFAYERHHWYNSNRDLVFIAFDSVGTLPVLCFFADSCWKTEIFRCVVVKKLIK